MFLAYKRNWKKCCGLMKTNKRFIYSNPDLNKKTLFLQPLSNLILFSSLAFISLKLTQTKLELKKLQCVLIEKESQFEKDLESLKNKTKELEIQEVVHELEKVEKSKKWFWI
ncbi:hypothetical protein HK099_006577 [Clydaea vesicula]|uniref:Uncharacterized protein n=1 Tax=Clydaea vesicula TaxID=447962 RepID=A0AAD5TXU8_9FUNG|nr:hypothetical protein HK099_006577 [Clydaea vesicula]